MSIINVRDNEHNRRNRNGKTRNQKKKQQTKTKEQGGTEAIVKGSEFVVHLSFNNYL